VANSFLPSHSSQEVFTRQSRGGENLTQCADSNMLMIRHHDSAGWRCPHHHHV